MLIINKNDLISKKYNLGELYKLGFKDTFLISAKSNLGITKLTSKIFEILDGEEINFDKRNLRISFVGRPNVGKSTLVNAVINEERMVTSKEAGTTLDSIEIEFKVKKNNYLLYDTAGLLKKAKTDELAENLYWYNLSIKFASSKFGFLKVFFWRICL